MQTPRKPGFFSRLFTGAKNIYKKVFPVAKSVMGIVGPGYLKQLKHVSDQIVANPRGERIAKGLSRITDISPQLREREAEPRERAPKIPLAETVRSLTPLGSVPPPGALASRGQTPHVWGGLHKPPELPRKAPPAF